MLAGGLISLIDPNALAFVLGGTIAATLARCGWRDMGCAGKALAGLLRPRFDEHANRKAIAQAVADFEQRGYLCADLPPPPDACLAAALNAYRRTGSAEAVRAHAAEARERREQYSRNAAQPFEQAGELAPVLGMAGTLLAIAQLVPGEGANAAGGLVADGGSATIAAIAGSVLSSLYGVILAHFLFVPLGRAIERRNADEEAARIRLATWAANLLEQGRPQHSRVPKLKDAA